MKPSQLFTAVVFAVVVSLVLTVGGLVLVNTRRPLPEYEGLAYVPGLEDSVEVYRDAWGVPHIYASSLDDLFFAQGYVQSQDRWWQMEFQRHVGEGRIQELTGFNPGAMSFDLLIRTWGWNRATTADAAFITQSETDHIMDVFARGINAYIAGRPGGDLALEYTLLGLTGNHIEVEPWETRHTLAWAKMMAYSLSNNASTERWLLELYETVGEEMTAYIIPDYDFETRPTIVTADDLPITTASAGEASAPVFPPGVDYTALSPATTFAGGAYAQAALPTGSDPGIGSNNWVVSGENSASGAPLLADDPHLGIQMPSIWYEMGLHCRPVTEECPYDVVGFSFVGVPGIIIGHNQQIAWGVTNVGPDTQDLYMIRLNPENPLQYEYNGEWRDMQVVTETIAFGGGYSEREDDPETPGCEGISDLPINENGDMEFDVRVTHFGPIVTDNVITDDCRFVGQNNDGEPLALRWTALEPGDLIRAILGTNRAQNWPEFRDALSYWDWPSQNFVYADVDGNIGYQTPGVIPYRSADHSGLVPVPGWTDEYEWQGYIPYDLLPRSYNPERGWIVTANNAVVPPEYDEWLAAELGEDVNTTISLLWASGYRAQRITELVSANGDHTPETFSAIQGDNHNQPAEEILPYLFAITFEDEALADAADWLRTWDLQNHMDSPQAALYESFWAALVHNLWSDELGYDLSGGSSVKDGTTRLLEIPDHAWWDNVETPGVETRDDILTQSLQDALDSMTENWGEDRDAWRWGDLHTATFVNNPMGISGIGIIEGLFNAGPVRVSGGSEIVNATAWSTANPFRTTAVPSLRMVVDFADFDNSRAIHSSGQSGHPFSPFYADMIDPWRFIRYHPMLFTQEAVEANAVYHLELRPSTLGE